MASPSISCFLAELLTPGSSLMMFPRKFEITCSRPEVMGAPTVFLASPEADGLTGERIVAKDFDDWLRAFRSRSADPVL
jgi:hypothetical protein